MKVLIVEDDGILAMDTMQQLMKMGHEVTGIAKSHETAVNRIESNMPDLILMDIRLYGPLSGIDITRIINQKYKVPVVYVTAHTDKETLLKINSTKHMGVVVKPFNVKQLKDIMRNVAMKEAS